MDLLKTYSIENDIKEKINLDIHYQEKGHKAPLVLIIHGFKAFRKWGFFPYVSERLAQAGAITLKFDFSLNGIVDADKMLYDVDKFAGNTISQQLNDFKLLLDKLDILIDSHKWNGRIYTLGHSLGGAISLITEKERNCFDKLALWSTVSTMDRQTFRQKEHWKKNGYMSFKESSTGQKMHLNWAYEKDKQDNRERFDPLYAISAVSKPVLIVHGEQDMTVKIREAEELKESYQGDVVFYKIPLTNHTFNTAHPFIEAGVQLKSAIKKTISFYGLNE